MILKLRAFPLAATLLLLLASCAGSTENVLPIPRSIKGASFVRGTEVIVRQTAAGAVLRVDERGNAPAPFAKMLAQTIADVTRASGLASGRPLKLIVEVDALKAPNAGRAFLGADDRLAGTVFVRDAETDEELGQLYVDVGRINGGMMGLLIRGGGVPEQLAEAFARRIATALGGRSTTSNSPH